MKIFALRNYALFLFISLCLLLEATSSLTLLHQEKPIPDVPLQTNNRSIALTFDDGPHPYYTRKLLEVLKEANVSATFFVVGKQVKKHPEILRQIYLDGHQIGNHTWDHYNLTRLENEEVLKELIRTHILVQKITGQAMRYFRPPGGRTDLRILDLASAIQYREVLWTILPSDHLHPPGQKIQQHVLTQAQPGSVILLHSGVGNTLEVLPQMIAELKREGYSFVTIDQLDQLYASHPALPQPQRWAQDSVLNHG